MLALRNAPARDHRPIIADRIRALSLTLLEEFSIPFAFYDGSTGEALGGQEADGSPIGPRGDAPPEALAIAAGGRPHVGLRGDACFRLTLPIREPDGATLIAIGELPSLAGTDRVARVEQARLQKWLQATHARLSFAGCSVVRRREEQPHLQQLKGLLEGSRELTDLLDGPEYPGESVADRERILRRAAAVVRAEALIWVPRAEGEPVIVEGSFRPSSREARDLARRLEGRPGWDPSGYLILNEVPPRGPADRLPGILNLIALPVADREGSGCLIVVNKRPPAADSDPDDAVRPAVAPFRRIDVALLKPFASLLGLHSRGTRRQAEVHDLFAGLVRSLTAAIDAKDPYTRGHSERVARIAVELAREMGLSETDLGDVYLAGLLHDIGKIGVPDSILGKREALTAEEFLQVTEHVLIGCRILEGFAGVAHLLPAVLSHHERYDGTGYPHGLEGEAIPLLARILAVADCFDAMNTARPYRAPLPIQEIEANLVQGRDRQWDSEVVNAFLRARERIYAIHPRGVGESVWFALHSPERGFQPHFAGRRPALHDLD